MATLIRFEFKKFFSKRKNLIVILILILFNLSYVLINNSLEERKLDYDLTSCNQQLQSFQQSLSTLKTEYNNSSSNNSKLVNLKRIIDYNEGQVNLLQKKQKAIQENNWNTKLAIEIQMDKALVDGIQQGVIITSENVKSIQSRIEINEILLDRNIKPIFEDCSMNSYNFIRLASINIIPLILIVVLLLLASDSVSSEMEDGTFKLLLTQPISRNKVMLAKIVTYTSICIITISVIFFVFFLGLGLLKGFGSPYYPVSFYMGNFTTILSSSKSYGTVIINIRDFILYIIPLYILLIVMVVAISVLISVIVGNSTGAISLSVVVYVTFYIFNSQLKLFTKVAHLIPFTYSNIPNILNGSMSMQFENRNITYANGIIVLILTTMICYLLSFVLFRKKDII